MINFPLAVRQIIEHHGLIDPTRPVVCAVSGGSDSVAMLCVLKTLGYRIHVAHCNFHLRLQESNRDEDFVRTLCLHLHLPLTVIHFDTENYAMRHHHSIELAARELRYRFFERLRQQLNAQGICVAHNKDDQIETFFLHLFRGSGMRGLSGMSYQRDYILRPLLDFRHQDILDYLSSIGQSHVEDSSNATDDYQRNRIRHHLMPFLERFSPQSVIQIDRAMANLREESCMSQYCTQQFINHCLIESDTIAIDHLLNSPSPQCVLHELISPLGFNRTQIIDILRNLHSPGRKFLSSTHQLSICRDTLIVNAISDNTQMDTIIDCLSDFQTHGFRSAILTNEGQNLCSDSNTALMDFSSVSFPLQLRPWRKGDRFTPIGMKRGSRLVSDLLAEQRVPNYQRPHQLLLQDSYGDIIWVVGHRLSEKVRVTENTKKILSIERIQK